MTDPTDPVAFYRNVSRQVRDIQQERFFRWVALTFGRQTCTPHERAARFLEEAIELAQAAGLEQDEVLKLVEHVFKKPKGEVFQEVGQTTVCLMGFASAAGISVAEAEQAEWDRVKDMDPNYFRRRHNHKADLGIATRGEEPSGG